jgi:phytoene dehydrogenase-like protein
MTTGRADYDAVVVGSGPNGLAAAIELARHGCNVIVLEASATPGGGVRSDELTLPGFLHDVCSAVYPLTKASPFISRLPLEEFGLEWITPPAAVAHPLDNGSAARLTLSIEKSSLGSDRDTAAYHELIAPFVARSHQLFDAILRPLTEGRSPVLLTRFGRHAVRSAESLACQKFESETARAMFAGLAGHSMLPLTSPISAGVGLVLAVSAHATGWPIPRGGAVRLTAALADYFTSLGGEIVCSQEVTRLTDLPAARVVLFDTGPQQMCHIAEERFPPTYLIRLKRFRYGPGVFKIDWALDGPIPFRAPECANASTVHLGGTLAEIAVSEQAVWDGRHPDRPFVLLSQPSQFDPGRAPNGKHTAWAYCHVPSGSTVDMTIPIENQVERFAPGFRKLILARHTKTAAGLALYNANNVGGDISGGVQDWRQLIARPVLRRSPYITPAKGLYLCSASTPPGGGVHGMCGFHAARRAIRDCF